MKAKLKIYWSMYISTLIYGYEQWVVTKRIRWLSQAAKISFLWKVSRFTQKDRMRSFVRVICERVRVEPLLLILKGTTWGDSDIRLRCLHDASQARCFWHFQLGRGPGANSRHAGEITSLGWLGNASVSPPEELTEMTKEREIWAFLLSDRCRHDPDSDRLDGW